MRAVPVLSEPNLGHYPEFRQFFADQFELDDAPFAPPPVLEIDGNYYELLFVGYSGQPFPAALEINSLVPGLEPMDEEGTDRALSALLMWLVSGIGGDWKVEDLRTVGEIYRIPALAAAEPT